MHKQMHVIAHRHPSVDAAGENIAALKNACLDPGFPVLAFAEIFVEAAEPYLAVG